MKHVNHHSKETCHKWTESYQQVFVSELEVAHNVSGSEGPMYSMWWAGRQFETVVCVDIDNRYLHVCQALTSLSVCVCVCVCVHARLAIIVYTVGQ